MNLSKSYFAIPDPALFFDRWLNAYSYQCFIKLNDKDIEVNWTKRAAEALNLRSLPLIVEMQLYFSCVVKKRVVFHDQVDFVPVKTVNDRLKLYYRAVQSAACAPETFVQEYPQQGLLESEAARNMQPSKLNIDYKNRQWQGEMGFGNLRSVNR